MSRGGSTAKGGKKKGSSFVIDYGKPVEDKIMDITSLEKFLQERIKIAGGKAEALGDVVTVSRDKSKVTVTSRGALLQETLHFLQHTSVRHIPDGHGYSSPKKD